jgi:lysozyme
MNLQEQISRIQSMMGVVSEATDSLEVFALDTTETNNEINEQKLVDDQTFVDYLKNVEGFKGEAYDDQNPDKKLNIGDDITGLLTIGYGHTGTDVKIGDTITEEEADTKLKEDIKIHFQRAKEYVTNNYPNKVDSLDLEQWEMLTDYAFNPGLNKFPKFAKAVVNKDWTEASKNYKRYYGGKELFLRNTQFFNNFLSDKPINYDGVALISTKDNRIKKGEPFNLYKLGVGSDAVNLSAEYTEEKYCRLINTIVTPQVTFIPKIMRYADYWQKANKTVWGVDLSKNLYLKIYYPQIYNLGIRWENQLNPPFGCKKFDSEWTP